jgi:hypothetical protein
MSNTFDPRQITTSVTGDKPAFIKVVFPSPMHESAGAGPVGGQTTEDYIRLSMLPQELRDRVVLYIKESLRA